MVWDATTTNAISNAVHAFFLLLYLIGACIHYFKKDHTFSLLIVFFLKPPCSQGIGSLCPLLPFSFAFTTSLDCD